MHCFSHFSNKCKACQILSIQTAALGCVWFKPPHTGHNVTSWTLSSNGWPEIKCKVGAIIKHTSTFSFSEPWLLVNTWRWWLSATHTSMHLPSEDAWENNRSSLVHNNYVYPTFYRIGEQELATAGNAIYEVVSDSDDHDYEEIEFHKTYPHRTPTVIPSHQWTAWSFLPLHKPIT